MDFDLIAYNLLRSTDGLNNLEVTDFCQAVGIKPTSIDPEDTAHVLTRHGEDMVMRVDFDMAEGVDILDVTYTVYDPDENDKPYPTANNNTIRITDLNTLTIALSEVYSWIS